MFQAEKAPAPQPITPAELFFNKIRSTNAPYADKVEVIDAVKKGAEYFKPWLDGDSRIYLNSKGAFVVERKDGESIKHLALSTNRERMLKAINWENLEQQAETPEKFALLKSFVTDLLRSPVFHEYDGSFSSKSLAVKYLKDNAGAPEAVQLWINSETAPQFEIERRSTWSEFIEYKDGIKER